MRRLLLAQGALGRLRARARLLERPLPAWIGEALAAALGDATDHLVRDTASLAPDAAYDRLLLAGRAAPGRADVRRRIQAIRDRRRRRYSSLEGLLALDLERRVALGDAAGSATALAAVYLDAGRDADVLALARALPHVEPALACLASIASANLGLMPLPAGDCPVWLDRERARYQPGSSDPDLPAGGFEGTLAPWVADGLPARVQANRDDGPAELGRRWSGQGRASTAGAGDRARARGRISAPAARIRHRYLTFWLGCRGIPGRNWEQGLGARLLVGGQTVRLATPQAGRVRRVVWDLGPWIGQTASIELVDASTDAWLEADAFTWLGALP